MSSTIMAHAGINFGVVFGALWHAPELVQLGQQSLQCAAVAQQVEHVGRLASASPRLISCQIRSGTRASTSPAATISRISARVSGATLKSVKRAAKRQAQYAHRVLAKGIGDMAQHLVLQVLLAVIGVK